VEAIANAVPEIHKALVYFLAFTGARIGEASALRGAPLCTTRRRHSRVLTGTQRHSVLAGQAADQQVSAALQGEGRGFESLSAHGRAALVEGASDRAVGPPEPLASRNAERPVSGC
jgi:hypothetical protein